MSNSQNPYDRFASGSDNPYGAWASGSQSWSDSFALTEQDSPLGPQRGYDSVGSWNPSSQDMDIPFVSRNRGNQPPPEVIDEHRRYWRDPPQIAQDGWTTQQNTSRASQISTQDPYNTPNSYDIQSSSNKAQRRRVHPKLLDDAQSEVSIDGIRESAYRAPDLRQSLVLHARAGILHRLTPHQQTIVQTPVPCTSSDSEMKVLLTDWITIFDKVFFFNSIKHSWGPNVIEYHGSEHGISNGQLAIALPREEVIRVYLNIPPPTDYTGTYETYYICVLLHEMLHAFIFIFVCTCSRCSRSVFSPVKGIGEKGHGAAWADTMTAIETALDRVVNWPVNCNLRASVWMEMANTDWHPRPDQQFKYGLLDRQRRIKGAEAFDIEPDSSDGGYDGDSEED